MSASDSRPSLAERYVRLSHGTALHVPGLIGAYSGPQDWSVSAVHSVPELRAEAETLSRDVMHEPDPGRRAFLAAQIGALLTRLRLLAGELVSYEQEVRGLYDLTPLRIPEQVFETALQELDRTLPGSGPVGERYGRVQERLTLPRNQILPLAEEVLAELRGRTRALLPLPEQETFTLNLVTDRPWSAQSTPLGPDRSRLDINAELPLLLTVLPDMLAHEGYPGHHTIRALRRRHLVEERRWPEFGLFLLNAPEATVHEGVAARALSLLFSPAELETWLTTDLALRAGMDPQDVQMALRTKQVRGHLEGVTGNAALMVHVDGASESQVLDYLMTYGLRSPEQARNNLEFIQDPIFRAYVFPYSMGGALLDGLLSRASPADGLRRVLTSPVVPGQIRSGEL